MRTWWTGGRPPRSQRAATPWWGVPRHRQVSVGARVAPVVGGSQLARFRGQPGATTCVAGSALTLGRTARRPLVAMATLAGLAWSRGAVAGRCLTTRCACRCRATTTGSASIQQPCLLSKWRDPTGGSHHGSRFASPGQTSTGRPSMIPLACALLVSTGEVGPTAWLASDGNSTWKGRDVL